MNATDSPGSITEIKTENEFNDVLNLSKAIIYFEVNWSQTERISWKFVSEALYQIRLFKIPPFKILVSEPILTFAEKWLLDQRQVMSNFIYGGWGETALIESGKIIDFIGCPAKFGFEKTKQKIEIWQES